MAQQLAVVQETHDSLRIILEDNETFDLVVDRVFTDLDVNHNGTLDTVEFQAYIARCCSNMGIRWGGGGLLAASCTGAGGAVMAPAAPPGLHIA